MKLGRFSLAFSLCVFALASVAGAVPTIDIGNIQLQPNQADQQFDVSVTGGDTIGGFLLYAEALNQSDGGPEIDFTALSFDNGIFSTALNKSTDTTPVVGFTYRAEGSATSLGFATFTADGVLFTLTADTTGISSGVYDFVLTGSGAGEDSKFWDASNQPMAGSFINGTITVIPEPATMSLLGLGAIAILKRRKK